MESESSFEDRSALRVLRGTPLQVNITSIYDPTFRGLTLVVHRIVDLSLDLKYIWVEGDTIENLISVIRLKSQGYPNFKILARTRNTEVVQDGYALIHHLKIQLAGHHLVVNEAERNPSWTVGQCQICNSKEFVIMWERPVKFICSFCALRREENERPLQANLR